MLSAKAFLIYFFSSRTITPVRDKQVLLIDIYNEWTGPCVAAQTLLNRMKYDAECLVLARACCDEIVELSSFIGYVNVNFSIWSCA